uniref:DUF1294 domain-containing protein n=1 Tax=Acrobeloides nanus TaxID=290746 RepID=A0A914EEK5_9BILA
MTPKSLELDILIKMMANETTVASLIDEYKVLAIIIMGYYLLINIICFLYMRADKIRAQNGEWRIPEAQLWLFSLIGGALGGFIAMIFYWHKIRNSKFVAGFLGLTILHLYLLYYFNVFSKLMTMYNKSMFA